MLDAQSSGELVSRGCAATLQSVLSCFHNLALPVMQIDPQTTDLLAFLRTISPPGELRVGIPESHPFGCSEDISKLEGVESIASLAFLDPKGNQKCGMEVFICDADQDVAQDVFFRVAVGECLHVADEVLSENPNLDTSQGFAFLFRATLPFKNGEMPFLSGVARAENAVVSVSTVFPSIEEARENGAEWKQFLVDTVMRLLRFSADPVSLSDEARAVESKRVQEDAAKRKKEFEYVVALAARLEPAISQHLRSLAVRKQQLLRSDPYGNVDNAKWSEERAVVFQSLIDGVVHLTRSDRFHVAGAIDYLVDTFARSHLQMASDSAVEAMTPHEFEAFCAARLSGAGWTTRLTKVSGDQGVDIVAEKGGIVVILQCKKYGKPVGNTAVQQAIAGRVFEGADAAAVVSNAPFTPAASQLARVAGVALLHFSELDAFAPERTTIE